MLRYGTVFLAAVLLFVLFFHGLTAAGLFGPDEPRYASIGREMARSGDFVTPRLWGEAWFEKPALLYWMIAGGFLARLPGELAPRVPIALASVVFLCFFWWRMRQEFGEMAAWAATLVLATSAFWIAFSRAAVTDLPLTICFAAAVMLVVGERPRWVWASAMLGLATLAKGLVPLVLVVPLAWFCRRRWREIVNWRVWAAFAAVSLPWYLLCYARNGRPFVQKFFMEHTFGRFSSPALQHVQPWWFYFPIVLAALLPWTPLLLLLRRRHYDDPRMRLLGGLTLFGLLFFSAALNKLPGYILPLLPLIAAQCGVALGETKRSPWVLALCGLPLVVYPAAAEILPSALGSKLVGGAVFGVGWKALLPLVVPVIVWVVERSGRRTAALATLALGIGCCIWYLEVRALPAADQESSARPMWRSVEGRRDEVCVEWLGRSMRYGLNYYSVTPLPDCSDAPRPVKLRE